MRLATELSNATKYRFCCISGSAATESKGLESMKEIAEPKVLLHFSLPGVRSFTSLEEAERAVAGLHAGGHAYILDVVFAHGERFLEARIHHYLTCEQCRRDRAEVCDATH